MSKRIAIIGLPGSGKSTFATKLGKLLDIPVHHLDKHQFIGKEKRDKEEFLEIQQALINEPSWIIDGCAISSLEMRVAKADLVLYFHFSRLFCLWRVFKRLFYPTPDTGCASRVNWRLLKYIWSFEKEKGKIIQEVIGKYPQKEFHIFRKPSEAEKFLAKARKKRDGV